MPLLNVPIKSTKTMLIIHKTVKIIRITLRICGENVNKPISKKKPAMSSQTAIVMMIIVLTVELFINWVRNVTTGFKLPALDCISPVTPLTNKKKTSAICNMVIPILRLIKTSK